MRPTVVLVLLSPFAAACINDRDTLIREVQSPPGVLTALTGRFERLPPAYYQARVARLQKVAKPTPEELDDLGAALDRLGRSREGFAVMERKAALPGLSREQRYRLHANRGTFLAHDVLKRKAPISELRPAIRDIEAALRLKPNAHFGREGVQLRTLRWILLRRTDATTASLGTHLSLDGDREKTAIALAGLIELGNAWESPDVVAAIGDLSPKGDYNPDMRKPYDTNEFARAGLYARLRYDELVARGIAPLQPRAADAPKPDPDAPEVREVARRWRAEREFAERRTKLRAAYVEAGIVAGRHPDTHPEFWRGWREPKAPTDERLPTRIEPGRSPRPGAGLTEEERLGRMTLGIGSLAGFGGLGIAALAVRGLRGRASSGR